MYPFNIGIIASQNSTFTPADLPGLVDWWTASSGVSLSSGAQVADWVGYKGKNLTRNGNYGTHPIFNSSDSNYGNKASITFTGASMFMDSSYSGVTNPTMIVIGNIGATTGQYNGIVGLSQVPGYNNFDRPGRISMFNKDSNNLNVFSDPPNSERNMSAPIWNTDVFYFEYGFDNANNILRAYSNNGFINQDTGMNYNGTFSGAPGLDTACSILYVSEYGANIGGAGINTYTDVIFVDKILTDQDRLNIMKYAATKYSIYDADAENYFTRVASAGATLSKQEKDAVNGLVLDLKFAGIYNFFPRVYTMLGGTSAACAVNLKNSSGGTFSGGWTFNDQGAKPNGIDAYFSTAYPFLNPEDIHSAIYTTENDLGTGGFGILGPSTTGIDYFYTRFNESGETRGYFDPSFGGFANDGVTKGLIVNKAANGVSQVWKNGEIKASFTNGWNPGEELPFANFYFGARNNLQTGSPDLFSTANIAFASVGYDIPTDKQSLFYDAIVKFQKALGREI